MIDWTLRDCLSMYFNRLSLIKADMLKRDKSKDKEKIREILREDYNRHKQIVLKYITADEIENINRALGFNLINMEDLKQ